MNRRISIIPFSRALRMQLLLCFAMACGCLCTSARAVETIYYPDYQLKREHSINFRYPLAMLQLAIEKSGSKVELKPYITDLPKKRSLMELKEGNKFDVYWGTTSIENERDLLPIKICLMKGLMGWRIPLVTRKNLHVFQNTHNLNGLRKFTAGQGTHWQDTRILQALHLKLETASSTDLLYGMLAANRFDYFPRGVQEIWEEKAARPDMDIAVDPHIALHYPHPFYFFVNRKNTALAQMIQQGLELAIKDGSFDKLFYKFYSEPLRLANLEERTVIELANPLLPPNTPLDPKALWSPAKATKPRN